MPVIQAAQDQGWLWLASIESIESSIRPCEKIYVSGSDYHSGKHGKYVADGTCDGKTFYKCKDCSYSDKQYLYYSSQQETWYIGPYGCGSTTVWLFGRGSGEPGTATWEEWSGSEWVRTSSISVSCNKRSSRSMSPEETNERLQGTLTEDPETVYEANTPTTPANADEPALAPTPLMPKEESTAVPTPTAAESDGAYALAATSLAAAVVLAFA